MIDSRICKILGIQYPILQGGMAWISDASLAGAVSNAGGLGLISAMNSNADYLVGQIRDCRKRTDKPFGVNIMLMSPYVDDVAQIVIDEHVSVVTTGAGLPSKYIESWVDAGIKVIPVVPSTAIAKRVEKMGATAVVAEGGESGGHVGDLTTMALVPQVCDAVDHIPVIAAGGIADGRGIAAAFMLGAEGVQCGTCFLVAHECTVHENYKERVLAARDTDTIVTGKRLGHPVRSLKNSFSRDYMKKEFDSSISGEELEQLGVGALYKAAKQGDMRNGCILAGQIAALVNKPDSAENIIKNMFVDAEKILQGAAKWVK